MALTNQNRIARKEAKKHKKMLDQHLNKFFKFLDSKPQPANEKVRAEFVRHEAEWRMYCAKHHLSAHVAELFNANVSLEWERKYIKHSQPKMPNVTPK